MSRLNSRTLAVMDREQLEQLAAKRIAVLSQMKKLTAQMEAIVDPASGPTCLDAHDTWCTEMDIDYARSYRDGNAFTVKKFFRSIECGDKPVGTITRLQIYQFVNQSTLKESSRAARLAAVRSFFRHAVMMGYVPTDISSTVRVNLRSMPVELREKVAAIPFTDEEFKNIMSNVQTPQFWRWATAMGYWLGLRLVDVAHLQYASLTMDYAVVYPQKTGRRLMLPLDDPIIGSGQLRTVFAEILAAPREDPVYCWPAVRWGYPRFKHRSIQIVYKEVIAKSGVTGKNFGSWRHTFRLRLSRSGKPIDEVSRLMGHLNIDTTLGYGRNEATAPSAPPQPASAAAPSGFPQPAQGAAAG